jgi:hypothetical protein
MAKKILIIDSGSGGRDFFSLILGRWLASGARLSLRSANKQWRAWAAEQKVVCGACPMAEGLNLNLGQVCSWWYLKLVLLKMAWWGGCDTVVLYHWPEKVMLSAWVRRLKLRLIWLEDGAVDYDRLAPEWRLKIVARSALAKVLAINEELVGNLTNLGYQVESLRLIPSCAWPEMEGAPQNMVRHFKLRKDYFTICAKVDWQDSKMAESLIKSLQLCLEVSPHFQLVLLGQGAGREQIRWLIKRYHLETQVWLLGDKPQNERSLEGFAVVVIGGRRPDWDDLSLALTAYEKKITVMGREGTILKDILESELGRVVEVDDQPLLRKIIVRHEIFHLRIMMELVEMLKKKLLQFQKMNQS